MKTGSRLPSIVPFAGAVLVLSLGHLVIIPRMARAAHQSSDALLSESLRYLRTEIQVYAEEHRNISPGYAALDERPARASGLFASISEDVVIPVPAADAQLFVRQLTQFTDTAGHVQPDRSKACDRGPYMIAMPQNPVTLKSAVLVVDQPQTPGPDESTEYGWIYNARTKRLIANIAGVDASGVRYANY